MPDIIQPSEKELFISKLPLFSEDYPEANFKAAQ